jgi:sugar-specific transcriptional regulator TrmB
LSRERVLITLMSLGLSETESKVFIYLAKKGPKKEKDLCSAFDLGGQQLHQILESLQRRGIVTIITEQYALFSALTFEEVLELLIVENIEQAQAVQKIRKDLLASWKNMIKQEKT